MKNKEYFCFVCGRKLDGECGEGGCFYFCVNKQCERYGLYVSQNIETRETKIKRFVFMNAPIITSIGNFTYDIETIAKIKDLLADNSKVERLSAIGHQSTADILTELFGFQIPLNRIQYKQEVGDYCIVFKLNGRPTEGKILSREEIEQIGYEFYVLEKL